MTLALALKASSVGSVASYGALKRLSNGRSLV